MMCTGLRGVRTSQERSGGVELRHRLPRARLAGADGLLIHLSRNIAGEAAWRLRGDLWRSTACGARTGVSNPQGASSHPSRREVGGGSTYSFLRHVHS